MRNSKFALAHLVGNVDIRSKHQYIIVVSDRSEFIFEEGDKTFQR